MMKQEAWEVNTGKLKKKHGSQAASFAGALEG